jgi:hypothetical protein
MKARWRVALTLVLAPLAASVVLAGGVKVKTQYDKEFKFAGLTTYAWHPTGAGDVKLMIADGNAEDLRRRLEPMVVQAVDNAMKQSGLTKDPTGKPAFYVYYYALIGVGTEAQEMGQFLPAVPFWGLPILPGATQSLKYYERGSLILDVTSVSQGTVVWRGIAQAEIDRAKTDAERQQRVGAAIGEMLKKFPPKK